MHKTLYKIQHLWKLLEAQLMHLGILFAFTSILIYLIIPKGIFGAMFLGILAAFSLLWSSLKIFAKNPAHKKTVQRMKRWIKIFFLGWLISFLMIEGFIVFSVRPQRDAVVDYVVVLGAGLKGEIPSLTLQRRLEKALDYLMDNPHLKVIVSGGQGPGESITEAEAMKRYLISHGISENKIIKEEKSTSTMENLSFTKEILDGLEGNQPHRIMLVTTDFHLFRSKYLARRLGLIPYGEASDVPFFLWINYMIREYFAVMKTLIIGG